MGIFPKHWAHTKQYRHIRWRRVGGCRRKGRREGGRGYCIRGQMNNSIFSSNLLTNINSTCTYFLISYLIAIAIASVGAISLLFCAVLRLKLSILKCIKKSLQSSLFSIKIYSIPCRLRCRSIHRASEIDWAFPVAIVFFAAIPEHFCFIVRNSKWLNGSLIDYKNICTLSACGCVFGREGGWRWDEGSVDAFSGFYFSFVSFRLHRRSNLFR